MFQKGDTLTIAGRKLRFLQDAQQLGDRSHGRITYGGIAQSADGTRYYVKYAGAFEGRNDQEYLSRVMQRWQMIRVQGERPMDFASPFLAQTAACGETVCKETDVIAVALAYADGISLPERVRQIRELARDSKKLNEAYRLRFDLIRQLLLGIRDYSEGEHGQVYVHRDLKPDNIRVQVREEENHIARQQLKILDFDFLLGPEEMPGRGGTAGYTHPDLYFGTGLDVTDPQKRFSWDLYSAGMLIYYIMEGAEHFSEEEFEEGGDGLFRLKPMQFDRFRPAFSDLVRSMVCRDQARYHSIDGVIADLEEFLHGFYGDYLGQRLFLPQYLEQLPGQEAGARQCSLLCRITEKDASGDTVSVPVWRSFTACDGSLLRLTYGRGGNICTAHGPETAREIGAISYLPGDAVRPLVFIPYSEAASCEWEEERLARILYEDRDYAGNVRGTLEIAVEE